MIQRKRRSGPDRFLEWKVALFFLAAGIWVGGAITGHTWLTGIAIVLLLIALVLRFLPRRSEPGTEQ